MELLQADRWIYRTLRDDTALEPLVADRVYSDLAPAGVQRPLIVFQVQAAAPDVHAVGSVRVMIQPTYLVRAIMETDSWAEIDPIADAIEQALHRKSGTTTEGGVIIGCVKVESFRLTEGAFRHAGGLYRLWVQ